MMYWKKSISDIIAAFVIQMLFFVPAYAGNVESGITVDRGGDFTLNSADGSLSLNELRGKVVLLFFGYTSCRDVCPIALSTIDRVFAKMTPDELGRVQALFISLDPERDTLEKLKKYTGYFHPNIVGVTEKPEVVAKVAEQYGIRYKKKILPNSALGYVDHHPADIFVVGSDEKLRNTLAHNVHARPLINRIRSLLSAER